MLIQLTEALIYGAAQHTEFECGEDGHVDSSSCASLMTRVLSVNKSAENGCCMMTSSLHQVAEMECGTTDNGQNSADLCFAVTGQNCIF